MEKTWILSICVVVLVAGFAGSAIAEQNQTAGINSDFLPEVKGASSDVPVGPPRNPMAGGEDCATATVISVLPYLDSGTTTGAANDYDATCPYSGGTAPDVVYAYTPIADEAVDITVCSNGGDADYDTKIYVFEGIANCGVADYACNDDACQAPSYTAAYNSELMGLALTGGTTYFIVVDGYGAASAGDYTLSVDVGVPPPPGPGCGDIGDPGFLLGQDAVGPDDGISAATSGQATWGSHIVAETIAQAADPAWFDIGTLNVWGLSALFDGASWNACDQTTMTFDVIFYEDNAGVPGTVICDIQSAVPVITDTGQLYLGFSLFQFDIPAACDLGSVGTKWFSVQSETMTPDCSFMWVNAASGDGQSLQDDGTGAWATATGYDRSMCINGSTIPVELQSFGIE